MRVVIQRVKASKVVVDAVDIASIDLGMVILLGIETDDNTTDVDWLVAKISGLRIFEDAEGKMNLDINDVGGSFLVISQFTLHASTKKGNRPSYIRAARPEQAVPLYEYFINQLANISQRPVKTGIFGADMKVHLINDGPVTITIDTKNRE
ncbi:MAG: D-tyrosyl-tRNA(Tyr) deacylase [Saprospiraceae bacterium]|nr:D-tyrosyl-tRNA(Tyr) deacylase [Saprospiraceae bacterium]MCZ2339782.1 D-tyrosyl-tRNA(Tyr) deacylase [Chitinophagales bacterium]